MLEKTDLHIYIDGSCLPHPRRGGIGIRFVYLEGEEERYVDFPHPGFPLATNNEMELKACLEALGEILQFSEIGRFNRIFIFSDSLDHLVKNQYNALNIWPARKWRRVDGLPLEHPELWKEFRKKWIKVVTELRGVRFTLSWKPRRSNEHMRAVDNMAKASAKACGRDVLGALPHVSRHRIPLVPGDPNFTGQTHTVLVQYARYQPTHRMTKYVLQVLSKGHADRGKKGVIWSSDHLAQRRRYRATFNKDTGDPGVFRILVKKAFKTKKETDQEVAE